MEQVQLHDERSGVLIGQLERGDVIDQNAQTERLSCYRQYSYIILFTLFLPSHPETRGVGFFIEGPERVKPAPAEAKCPPSKLVYIRCLVRPFTAGQLSSMIEQHFGKPEELWLDKIKSSAVVRQASEDAAKR